MGYATYIGRVGALAVALGIGAAVANTPGVAWAEPSDSTSGSSSSESDSASESPDKPAESDDDSPAEPDAKSADDPDDEDVSSGSTGGMKVSAQTNDHGSPVSTPLRSLPRRLW